MTRLALKSRFWIYIMRRRRPPKVKIDMKSLR
jgi:hypothetical protein